MFIDRYIPNALRRSEERNELEEYLPTFVPLLRTAPGKFRLRSYKHLTPSGVRFSTPLFPFSPFRLYPISLIPFLYV